MSKNQSTAKQGKDGKKGSGSLNSLLKEIEDGCEAGSSVVVVIGDRTENTFSIITNDKDGEYVYSVLDAASDHVAGQLGEDSYVNKISKN
jgi:hypothetical protein